MAEEPKSSSSSTGESQDLFRHLQGEATLEQFQEWSKLNAQTNSLLLQSPHVRSGSESEALLSPGLLSSFPVPESDSDTVPQVLSFLDPDSSHYMQDEENKAREEGDDSRLGFADAASRLSALTQLQKRGRSSSGDDFSAIALSSPAVLGRYLTGEMTFEEFFRHVDEAKRNQGRGDRSRKRKADGDFVYEEDEDYEAEEEEVVSDEDSLDDSWIPDSSKATGPGTQKKPRKVRRRRWELPKKFESQMGAAHCHMVDKRYEEAIQCCSDLIMQAPYASEPYDTLGRIYDEQGDSANANEFYLISAYLKRTDSDVFVELAHRLLDHNETRKAMECLNRAIKFATTNKVELMLERCSLYEQMGEMSRALMEYSQILSLMKCDSENDDKYLKLARKVCEKYHSMKRTNDAARVLTTMFKTHPSLINSEDTNKLLDLRLAMKQYQACLEGLVDYCGVEATLKLEDGYQEWNQNSPLPDDLDLKTVPGVITNVRVPGNLPNGFPLDLLAKLCTCLIYLGFSLQAKNLVTMLLKEDVEENGNGERFLDVADAYMDSDQCNEALPILRRCINSQEYSQAAVWLRYGECLSALGQLPDAVEAFSRVVELAPNHLAARVSLSALQQQIGRHDEALQVLSGDCDGDTMEITLEDQTLLLHKCHLLFSQKRNAEFLVASRRLLFHYFHEMYTPGILKIPFIYRSQKHRREALETYMREQQEEDWKRDAESKKNKDPQKKEYKVSSDELWDLYLKLCDVLLEEEKWDDLSEVTILGLTCPAFYSDPMRAKDAEFLCLTVCMMTKNGQFAYNFIKHICLKEPDNKMAWNLFNQSLIFSNEIRHHKFCLRRLMQWPNNLALGMMTGHNSIQNGSYRCALGEYVNVFRRAPTDPLINLCIGLCYIHICCQKFTPRRDWLVLQGFAFLNSYLSLRGECQESYYNLGRAMHQLDLGYAAVYYYKKALALPPVIEDEEGNFDLKREIAFNLSLIYKKSGNMDLARLCTQTYIVV